jgi:glycosyltransferase involved in cell wall biosynthesis
VNVGLADHIRDADAGIVTTMKPAEVAAGIISVLTDPELSARLRNNGRTLVDDYFTEDSVIGKLKDMYETVVQL